MERSAFGALLFKLRSEKQMRQEDLAAILNVSKSAISKWENGKNYPDFEMLKNISEVFGLSCDSLLNPEETLARMEKATELHAAEEPYSPEKADSTPSKRRLLFPMAALTILAVAAITCVIIFAVKNSTKSPYQNPSETADQPDPTTSEPVITMIGERYIHSPLFENKKIYEVAYVCEKELTKDEIKALSPEIHDKWVLKEGKNPITKILKISFYTSEEDAKNWAEPNSFLYIEK